MLIAFLFGCISCETHVEPCSEKNFAGFSKNNLSGGCYDHKPDYRLHCNTKHHLFVIDHELLRTSDACLGSGSFSLRLLAWLHVLRQLEGLIIPFVQEESNEVTCPAMRWTHFKRSGRQIGLREVRCNVWKYLSERAKTRYFVRCKSDDRLYKQNNKVLLCSRIRSHERTSATVCM